MLTALFRFRATGGGGDSFLELSDFSFDFGVAVTVMPRVANILATALASDFFGLFAFEGWFLTDNVIESERCITLFSEGSCVPPWK